LELNGTRAPLQGRHHLTMHETKIGERMRGITPSLFLSLSLFLWKGAATLTKIFCAFNEQVGSLIDRVDRENDFRFQFDKSTISQRPLSTFIDK